MEKHLAYHMKLLRLVIILQTNFTRFFTRAFHCLQEFYYNLGEVKDKYQFNLQDIHNADESGCSTVQKPKDVVTKKGKKQSHLRREASAFKASFPRKNYRDDFIKGGPIGASGPLPTSISPKCSSLTIHYLGSRQRKRSSEGVVGNNNMESRPVLVDLPNASERQSWGNNTPVTINELLCVISNKMAVMTEDLLVKLQCMCGRLWQKCN